MGNKMISIKQETYDKIKSLKTGDESFDSYLSRLLKSLEPREKHSVAELKNGGEILI